MFVYNPAPGLGDADRAMSYPTEIPVRLAEMAQRILAGDLQADPVYATPQDAARDLLNTAIAHVQELEATGQTGSQQRTGPVTGALYSVDDTPIAIQQSYAEIAYTANLLRQSEQQAAQAAQDAALQAQQQQAQQQVADYHAAMQAGQQAEAQRIQANTQATQAAQQTAQVVQAAQRAADATIAQQNAQAAQIAQQQTDYAAQMAAALKSQQDAIDANAARLQRELDAARAANSAAAAQAAQAAAMAQAGAITQQQAAQAEIDRQRALQAAAAAAAALQQYQAQAKSATSNGTKLISNAADSGAGAVQYDPNGGTFMLPGGGDRKGIDDPTQSPGGASGFLLLAAAVGFFVLSR